MSFREPNERLQLTRCGRDGAAAGTKFTHVDICGNKVLDGGICQDGVYVLAGVRNVGCQRCAILFHKDNNNNNYYYEQTVIKNNKYDQINISS